MNLTIRSLEHLFISKVRIKALAYFTLKHDHQIHLRGAVRELDEEINAVRRELTRLEEMKIINGESKGNRKYFSLNKSHPFTDELIAIFHKTFGLGGDILNNIKNLGEINFAFLTPSFTKNQHFGSNIVDFVVIGKVDMKFLEELIKKAENEIDREIHYTVFTLQEFQVRKRRNDQFIFDLMVQDLVMLIGTKEEFIA